MPGLLDYLSEKYQPNKVQEINERLVELSSLFEISQILNSSLELDRVLNNILLIPMGRLMISRGVILLKKNDCFEPRLWKGISGKLEKKSIRVGEFPPGEEVLILPGQSNDKFVNLQNFVKSHKLHIVFPIKSQERLIGLAIFGKKLNRIPFNAEEIDFLRSLINLSATAVENALQVDEIRSINLQLDQKIQQLKTLFDIARGLSATLDSDKIIKLLTYALMGQMLVNQYAVVLFGKQHWQRTECKGFTRDTLEALTPDILTAGEIENAMFANDFPRAKVRKRLSNLKAEVFIPLRHQNQMIGYILLGKKITGMEYTENDLEFLTTLVSQAVISLENARLFRETLEKQRIEQELEVAKNIQKKLLPREIPRTEKYDFWGVNIPSKEVGGDYFDIIPISQDRYALAIGDVSGKSVPASLLMANLQAGLRTIVKEDIPLPHLVNRLNFLIYQNTDLDKYITFFIGILDIRTDKLQYLNAGHNPPLYIDREGKVQQLEEGGIILGMMPEFSYRTGTVQFKPNDLLLCYTDGVNEALNPEEEEFGEERLKTLVTRFRHLPVRELADKIVQELRAFSRGAEQADDITLLVSRRHK